MPLVPPRILTRTLPTILIGVLAAGLRASPGDLAAHFGFEPLEVLKIGRFAGPIVVSDLNGDGLNDLLVVHNHASRIELHLQRPDAEPSDEPAAAPRVNEFPEHWRFRRQNLPVTTRVTAVVPHDFDADGLVDLVYAGATDELVFVRQTGPGVFETERRHRVRNLSANRDALAVADLTGDARPELVSLVKGRITIWPLDGADLGPPRELGPGDGVVAFVIEDFDGDGLRDIAGIIPEDAAPLRVWFAERERGASALGAQVRFEMPPLRECTPLRLPARAACFAVIERASKRLVVHAVEREPIRSSGDREAAMRVFGFTDPGNRARAEAIVDVDGDGLPDLVATDTTANAVVVYRQRPGQGFGTAESYPSLSDLAALVAGNVDDDPEAELFVLSEKEGVVGRCDVAADGSVPFPVPLAVSAGHEPTAINLVRLESGPHLAIVAKEGRDYVVDLLAMDGTVRTIPIGKQSRSPETIVAVDADQDGRTDLLLFTRDKPMMMLHADADDFTLTESDAMGQYGLVKSASADNIAVCDVDDDGRDELLIAEKNFVRAVRYEPDPGPGVSPGWQVVRQMNAVNSDSKLVSLAILGSRIIAADTENARLLVMAREGDGPWRESESISVRGFAFDAIHAGRFSGDDDRGLLAIGSDGFAVLRAEGTRFALGEIASWRSDSERRVHHELAVGDVNDDGFVDLLAVDAGEQMCEIFTFSEAERLLHALGFQIFESRLFSGGSTREYEPSQVLAVDVTGDGRQDVVMLTHDRVLVYPQMAEP